MLWCRLVTHDEATSSKHSTNKGCSLFPKLVIVETGSFPLPGMSASRAPWMVPQNKLPHHRSPAVQPASVTVRQTRLTHSSRP